MALLIVALNPSIDVECRVEQVQWEEKNQILSERRWAGGKGVNVARWLQHLGGKPRLLLPLGGSNGEELAASLRRQRLPARVIPLRENTRANIIVSTAAGRQLRFNPPGPKLSAAEWRSILRQTERDLPKATLLVLSGSLPRGLPADAYAQLIWCAHRAGIKTLLDCDGAAFAAGVAAKPFLAKPNVHELAQWWGKPLASKSGIKHAASVLAEKTGGWILVSMGRDGALLMHEKEQRSYSAFVPRVKTLNTVGAGDAMLAAVARGIECESPPEEWLRQGVAVGTAATQCGAGELPKISLIRRLANKVVVVSCKMPRVVSRRR
jgi:1-phosphofructokinase family hexose kinase